MTSSDISWCAWPCLTHRHTMTRLALAKHQVACEFEPKFEAEGKSDAHLVSIWETTVQNCWSHPYGPSVEDRLTLEVGVHIADVTHFLRPGTVGIPRQPEMLGAWRIMSRRADRCSKSLFQTLFDSIGHWQVLVGHRYLFHFTLLMYIYLAWPMAKL